MRIKENRADTDAGQDETALVLAARGGCEVAFRALFEMHAGRLHRFFKARTRSLADAEDLSQQTWLAVWRGLKTFDSRRAFSPWLYAVARNRLHDLLRSRLTKGETEVLNEGLADDLQTSPAISLSHKDDIERLWALASSELSARQFDAVWLQFREEMPIREIASVLGLTQVHTRVILYRARRALIRAYAEQFDSNAPDALSLRSCRKASTQRSFT